MLGGVRRCCRTRGSTAGAQTWEIIRHTQQESAGWCGRAPEGAGGREVREVAGWCEWAQEGARGRERAQDRAGGCRVVWEGTGCAERLQGGAEMEDAGGCRRVREGAGGCERVQEGAGGCGEVWEGVGMCERVRGGVRGRTKVWEDTGQSGRAQVVAERVPGRRERAQDNAGGCGEVWSSGGELLGGLLEESEEESIYFYYQAQKDPW
ncbi:hypothetical protein BV22DRAFT_1052781, partial [Leucogyrophana mollusca]